MNGTSVEQGDEKVKDIFQCYVGQGVVEQKLLDIPVVTLPWSL